MSVKDNNAYTKAVLGNVTTKTYTVATETANLFTVAGGLVLITGLVGQVTTAITVANTVKLQANPTTGTTQDIFAATDIGTTDTPAGDLIGVTGAPADGPLLGIGCVPLWGTKSVLAAGDAGKGLIIAPGTIDQVTTGTNPDGVIVWYVTWVPLVTGATIVAA
jgi:hypothetical protein